MEVTKGQRAFIQVAGIAIEVFMLPNGEYRYSNTSASNAIGLKHQDSSKYLERTNPQAAEGSVLVSVGKTRVKGLTEAAVVQYWQWKASNGNTKAQALVTALAAEALTRRADSVFGCSKSEEQYEVDTAALRLELLQGCIDGYSWVSRTKVDGRLQEQDIMMPRELTSDEVEVLSDLAYLKRAYYQGWVELVPNIVAKVEQRLRQKGLALQYNNPDVEGIDKASFTILAV